MKSEDNSVAPQPPQSATPPSSVTPSSSTFAQSLFFNNEAFTSRLLAACQERQSEVIGKSLEESLKVALTVPSEFISIAKSYNVLKFNFRLS
jgi:hypothetical protein